MTHRHSAAIRKQPLHVELYLMAGIRCTLCIDTDTNTSTRFGLLGALRRFGTVRRILGDFRTTDSPRGNDQ